MISVLVVVIKNINVVVMGKNEYVILIICAVFLFSAFSWWIIYYERVIIRSRLLELSFKDTSDGYLLSLGNKQIIVIPKSFISSDLKYDVYLKQKNVNTYLVTTSKMTVLKGIIRSLSE